MLGYKKGNKKLLTGQIPLHYPADRTYLDGDPTKTVQDKCARKADLTNLDLTGTTNTTGSTIASGTYFYLNGTLVRAKTAIASGATFTLDTNYETVPKGALNNKRVGAVTLTGLANGTNNVNITFDSALPSIPFVCVTLKNASDNNHIRKDCYCWVGNISKTGFRLYVFNGGASNITCEYDYLAIV